MKVEVLLPSEIELKPGDEVILNIDKIKGTVSTVRVYHVKKLVETKYGTYAVFNNRTWRPMSTYNITWRKVE